MMFDGNKVPEFLNYSPQKGGKQNDNNHGSRTQLFLDNTQMKILGNNKEEMALEQQDQK